MTDMPKRIHIVFDGPPGPEAGRFVEVEDDDGRSIRVGDWEQRDDCWHLVIPIRADAIDTEARAQIRREVVESLCKITRPGYPSDFLRETDLRAWLAEQEANDSKLTGRNRESGE